MSICIVHNAGPHFIKKKSEIENKTVSEILKTLPLTGCILAFENDKYWEPLKPDCIPLNEYPELINDNPLGLNTYPTVHLTALISDFGHKFGRKILISSQLDKTVFPPLTITLSQNDYESLKISDVIQLIEKIFEYEHSDPKLFQGDNELDPSENAKPYLNSAKNDQLRFFCNIADVAIKNIKLRECLSSEILTSEEAFIRDLKALKDFWKPRFLAKIKFTEAQHRSLFRDIEPIYNVHSDLLNDMQKPPTFASCYGGLLMNYISRFKIAAAYVSNFNNVDKLIKSCREKSSFNNALNEIEAEDPYGRDFLSYYVTPVQRYPRYPLLLRDLNKRTPNWHPDKIFLQRALVELESVNKQNDNTAQRVKSLMMMESLSNELPDSYEILKFERMLLQVAQVRLIKPKGGLGSIYLFNDIILLTQKEKKKQIPLFQIDIEKFHYFNCCPNELSLTIYAKKTKKIDSENESKFIVTFIEDSDKKIWMEALENARNEKYPSIANDKSRIIWSDINVPAPTVCGHSGCRTENGKIFFFGGLNRPSTYTNDLIEFVNGNFNVIKTKVPPRTGHTMTAIGNNIYICFGKGKSSLLNDIWVFNTETRIWEDLSNPYCKSIPARANHTCVSNGSDLIFFGGEGESGLLKDVSSFDTEKKIYSCINDSSSTKAPSARRSHSASVVGRNMVIFGGKNEKEICGDLNLYDIQKNKWKKMKSVDIEPRICHLTYPIYNRFLLIIGGQSSTGPKKSVLIDMKIKKSSSSSGHSERIKKVDFVELGNTPPGLTRFAIAPLDEDNIIVFGGCDGFSPNPIMSAYKLNVTEGLRYADVADSTDNDEESAKHEHHKGKSHSEHRHHRKRRSEKTKSKGNVRKNSVDSNPDSNTLESSELRESLTSISSIESIEIGKKNKEEEETDEYSDDNTKSEKLNSVDGGIQNIQIEFCNEETSKDSATAEKENADDDEDESNQKAEEKEKEEEDRLEREEKEKIEKEEKDRLEKERLEREEKERLEREEKERLEREEKERIEKEEKEREEKEEKERLEREEKERLEKERIEREEKERQEKEEKERLEREEKEKKDKKDKDKKDKKDKDKKDKKDKDKKDKKDKDKNKDEDTNLKLVKSNSHVAFNTKVMNTSAPVTPISSSQQSSTELETKPQPPIPFQKSSSTSPKPIERNSTFSPNVKNEDHKLRRIDPQSEIYKSSPIFPNNRLSIMNPGSTDPLVSAFQEQFGVDMSQLDPIKKSQLTMKIKRFMTKKRENDAIEEKVKRYEVVLNGDHSKMPCFDLLMKISDTYTQTTKITKITSNASPDDIKEIVHNKVNRDVMLSVLVQEGQFEDLNDESLCEAYWSVYKGDLRSLYINVI